VSTGRRIQALDLYAFAAGARDDQAGDLITLFYDFDIRICRSVLEGGYTQSVRGQIWGRQGFLGDLNPAVQVMFHGEEPGFWEGKSTSLAVAGEVGWSRALAGAGGAVLVASFSELSLG